MGNYVNDVDSMFWAVEGPFAPPTNYAALDPDEDGNILIDLRGMTKLTLYLTNGNGAATINWKLLGSIDGGQTWDFVEKVEASIAGPGSEEYWWTNWKESGGRVYTNMLLQTKSAGAGALTVKISST